MQQSTDFRVEADQAIMHVACNATVNSTNNVQMEERIADELMEEDLDACVVILQQCELKCQDENVEKISTNNVHVSSNQVLSAEQIVQSALLERSNVYAICPKCKCLCEDDAVKFRQQSVMCERCSFWFHMSCAKLTKCLLKALSGKPFVCQQCMMLK